MATTVDQSYSISTINKLHKLSLILLSNYNLNPVNTSPFYIDPKTRKTSVRTFIFDTVSSNAQGIRRNKKYAIATRYPIEGNDMLFLDFE